MATLTVLRGIPSELAQDVGQRLTRQSDQWAIALNEALRAIAELQAKVKALEARLTAHGI